MANTLYVQYMQYISQVQAPTACVYLWFYNNSLYYDFRTVFGIRVSLFFIVL